MIRTPLGVEKYFFIIYTFSILASRTVSHIKVLITIKITCVLIAVYTVLKIYLIVAYLCFRPYIGYIV